MAIYSWMMLVGGVVGVVFMILLFANFFLMGKKMMNLDKGPEDMLSGMTMHLGFGVITSIGVLTCIAGFIWFLVHTYA